MSLYATVFSKIRSRSCDSRRHGFALVVTVSLMVLLTLVAVGLLSLSAITLRGASQEQAMSTARANARMALMVALGELQKHAGPDRRVTGPGTLGGDEVRNPHWTGVWSTVGEDTLPVWLVSGNEARSPGDLDQLEAYPTRYFQPGDDPGEGWQVLHSATESGAEVSAPPVLIDDGSTVSSRYAWWISDEGTKARVDVRAPDTPPRTESERLVRSHGSQENGIRQIDPRFDGLGPLERNVDKRRILTHDSIDLCGGGPGLAREFIHDLTTGGYGLPVNVVEGGMKADLSLAFDSSQRNSGYAEAIMGATPSEIAIKSARVHDFGNIRRPERFFLVSELSLDGRLPVGPNWGIAYNYHHLWRNIRRGQIPFVEMNPQPRSDLRTNNWPPYRNLNRGAWKNDRQHTNTTVTPVISMLQVGFRLSAERKGENSYQVQLQMKPVIGIWNPYNARLQDASYYIDWALYPYLRVGVEAPGQRQYHPRTWMREHWLARGNAGPGSLDRWLRLETPSIDLEPGEIRLFSVDRRADLRNSNQLVSRWNEEGAFVFDLQHAGGEEGMPAGSPVIVPRGSRVWYEELLLEDSQHPETLERFGDTYVDGVSASWLTFKTGGDATLNRTSDLWQTPTSTERGRLPYLIPEPVRAGAAGIVSASPRLSVESLATSPLHIGTWRWVSRNASDAENDTQDLRGWIDTNPRYAATNPMWDGSRTGEGSSVPYEGWFFLSPFIGGSHDDVYDGGPPNRGKVAEGQNEVPSFPEASLAGGRYRGFGGYSSDTSGQSHVILYDVPRGPLVSLGQLQHAQFSRYGYEPGFAFGNSYANPRIPLDQIQVENFMEIEDFTMFDLSYGLNRELWDGYFFSTIGRDYLGSSGSRRLDDWFDLDLLASGKQSLPNPRHRLVPQPGDSSFEDILKPAGENGSRALAARVAIDGAFNVNSTSVEAWKAVLSSMADFEFPVLSLRDGSTSWSQPTGIRFPSMGHVAGGEGWQDGDGPLKPDFWRGYRRLSSEELDALAKEIVREVRLRGPFRSFAGFVNRDPDSSDDNQQRKGPLQAALDRALNSDLGGAIGGTASKPQGRHFSEAVDAESEAAGFAGYLMQGDVLQSLAPVLQVRSDYFRIRASGECRDREGRVIARAVCEAYVQRSADFIDPRDLPEAGPDELVSFVNQRFGRRFRIQSFRWVSAEEI